MSGNYGSPVLWKPQPAPTLSYAETEIVQQPLSGTMRQALAAYRHAQPKSELPHLLPEMKV